MRNRYGNFITGKYNYVQSDSTTIYTYSGPTRSIGSLQVNSAQDDRKFDYTSYQGGFWGINSSFEFPKIKNKTYTNTTGLTDVIDCLASPSFASWSSRNVDISRFANRSARIVFRYSQLNRPNFPLTDDIYIDSIAISSGTPTYGFETTGDNFQTTTSEAYLTEYRDLTWTTVASTRGRNLFARANTRPLTFGTSGNGNFGIVTTYDTTYNELVNKTMWLRSPVVSFGASPTFITYFYYIPVGYDTSLLFTYLDLQ